MAKEKVKTGLIGCGKVGRTHANALQALDKSEFVAAFSRTEKHANEFADIYSITPYTDLEKMLDESGVEAILVCTPHPVHAAPTVEAAKRGIHSLIEKPLASSLEDCDAMLSEAKKNGVNIGMISQRRLYPSVQRIRSAIDEGKIGKPVLGTVNMLGWRDKKYYDSDDWRGTWKAEGGGVLVNQAPHQIDLFQWFMGPVDQLFGFWDNLNHPYIEVEDTAVAVLRFKSGALGNIVVSNSQNPALYGKVAVFGENGASIGVQTDGGAMFIAGMSSITEPPVNDLWTIPGEEELLEKWKKEDTDLFNTIDATEYFHHLQIEDFLNAIIEHREPMVTGEDGRKTVEIFTALYRSKRDNSPISFPLTPEYDRDDFDGRVT